MAPRARTSQPEPQAPDPTATTPEGGLRLDDAADNPAAKPGKALEEGGQGKATVRVPWPHDRFEHNVDGVEPITAAGVEVERSKLGALLKAAAEVGIELEEVVED